MLGKKIVLGIVSTVLGVYGFTIRVYEEQSYPTKILCIVLNLQKLWNETK